jgi:hypothetical protein
MVNVDSTKIFVSYARRDGAELAHRLHKDLAQHGFQVWLGTQELSGGATWTTEIEQAIDSSLKLSSRSSHQAPMYPKSAALSCFARFATESSSSRSWHSEARTSRYIWSRKTTATSPIPRRIRRSSRFCSMTSATAGTAPP